MKVAYILVGILILVGAYFLLAPETQAPTTNEAAETENLPINETTEEPETTETPEAEPGDDEAAEATDAGMEFPTIDEETGAKVFTVDSFSFGYTPSVIRVSEGDTVTINLTNSGGLHDWVVDEFDAATARIGEGDVTTVTFVADQKGEFEFYCSVGNHRERGMVGTLIVE